MKPKIFTPILIALLCFTLQSTHAASVIYNLNTVFGASGSPVTTGASATATFQDISPGVVNLTLAYNQGSGSGFSVSGWGINLASSVVSTYNNTLTFLETSKSAGLTTGTVGQNATKYSYGLGSPTSDYDIYINAFGANTFVSGDFITYKITSSASGLTASDFVGLSSTTSGSYNPDTYYTAALLYAPGSKVYYLGATSVPEPSSVALLGGLGLIGWLMVKRNRKNQTQTVLS